MSPGLLEAHRRQEAPAAPPYARRTGAARKLGRVDVHEDPVAADGAWKYLEETCPGSVYQTRRYLLPWLAAYAKAGRITPMIVVAHDSAGEPVALLPFGSTRRSLVTIAGFLGGADSNSNCGLFRPDVDFSPADLESLLRASASKARNAPDLFLLANQPERFEGARNPLDIFPHQPSPSFCHAGSLNADPNVFSRARLSGESAKKLRRKVRRLEEAGSLKHFTPRTALEAARVLDAFFQLKLARFREMNIRSGFEQPASRAFIESACCVNLEDGHPAIELHALTLDERIIAIFGAGRHRGHLHLMFNAFDMEPEIARSSPGDILLHRILEQMCCEGLDSFDLGIGEARYKQTWCDHAEPMFDSILALTPAGHAFRIAETTRRQAKRRIKQSAWAWPIAQRLMRWT